MEIIEKEKIVEHQDGYYGPNKRDINGKANAGLTLGIIGTALGAWALFGNRRAGLLGGAAGGIGGGSTNINVNGIEGMSNGLNAPTAFQAWEKGCEDTLALQGGLYNWALTQQNQRFQDRQTIDSEMFGLYKSQVDADFGLYKSTRDGFDVLNARQQQDAFNLYKSQRDADDSIMKEHFNTKYARGRGRGRGMRDSDYGDFFEEEDMRRFDDFYINRHNSESDFIDMVKNMNHEEKKKLVEMIEGGEGSEHFNDSYAKYTVSKMFHTEGGRKYVGEKFDMLKAKEICERYRGIIPQSATHGDVYVAINAQYHDYCELFKAWFGDSVDSKIVESAINFWFKDDDFKGNKVWKYFNMM